MRKCVMISFLLLFSILLSIHSSLKPVRASSGYIADISISVRDQVFVTASLHFYFDTYTSYQLVVRKGETGPVVASSFVYNFGAIGYDDEQRTVHFYPPSEPGLYTYVLFLYMKEEGGSWYIADEVSFQIRIEEEIPSYVLISPTTTTTTSTTTEMRYITYTTTMTERKFYELTRTITETVVRNITVTKTIEKPVTITRTIERTTTSPVTTTKTLTVTSEAYGGLLGGSALGLIVGLALASVFFILRSRAPESPIQGIS